MGAQPVDSSGDDDVMRDLRREASIAPALRNDEENSLLEKSARGDRTSQERLVAAHLAMVIKLAEAREDKGLSLPDLVQEGSLGFVEAVRSFAAGGEVDFATFAERKVVEQMDAAIASEATAVRDAERLVAAAGDYERTELLLRRGLTRPPTEIEIAEKLEWTVERTRYVARVVADARRQHDEELLQFIDPYAIDLDNTVDSE
jgi:DNA-directed RNA polymerase sigma subunit (sigma70/sigma32)